MGTNQSSSQGRRQNRRRNQSNFGNKMGRAMDEKNKRIARHREAKLDLGPNKKSQNNGRTGKRAQKIGLAKKNTALRRVFYQKKWIKLVLSLA
jgi:hypothetical protein